MVGRLLSFGKGPIFSGYVSFREGISVGLARYLMKKDEYEPGPKVLVICSLKFEMDHRSHSSCRSSCQLQENDEPGDGHFEMDLWKMENRGSVPKWLGTSVDGWNPAPVEVGSLSHYLHGFIHPRWGRISSINSWAMSRRSHCADGRHYRVSCQGPSGGEV